ncbi:MAG: hypothetical protein ACK44W_17585, partial [Planctomycetota bacterium]
MKCPSRQELLDAAHGRAESPLLRTHLDACPSCRKTYEEFAILAENLARLAGTDPCPPIETLAAWVRNPGLPETTRHVGRCPACREAMAELEELLSAEPDVRPSERLRRKVLSLVSPVPAVRETAARRHRGRMPRPERPGSWGWAAAAAQAGPRPEPGRAGGVGAVLRRGGADDRHAGGVGRKPARRLRRR